MINLSSETFEAQKSSRLRSLPGRCDANSSAEEDGEEKMADFLSIMKLHTIFSESAPPDVLRHLLPGLCHLVAEDKPREILLSDCCKLHEILFSYLNYHWTIYRALRDWIDRRVSK